jgi:hypothetical protein
MAKVTLSALVAATASTAGFMYATEKDVKALVTSGDAEINMAMPNPANAKEFPVRATEAGKAKQAALDAAASTPAPSFTFETGPALARSPRGGGRTNKYPFADFAAPTTGADGTVITARIFVPATAAMPDPAKSLSSTVSAASRVYARVVGSKPGKNRKGEAIQKNIYEFDRKFSVVPGVKGDVKGAYIERVK